MKNTILSVSRQDTQGPLTGWMDQQLTKLIENNSFKTEEQIAEMREGIVDALIAYRHQAAIATVVVGMSGGVDSALTAALFKEARWTVIGVVMPIHQNPEETERGIEACNSLGIESHVVDLSDEYDVISEKLNGNFTGQTRRKDIMNGNIRAKLRMITLYNYANARGGLVASTDNFSELTAGFWTLHGDVGDLSPIQSFWKSWEVPVMARLAGVPKSIYTAKPTDGLGIDDGDEAQFGCSYLEWDIMTMSILAKDVNVNDERSRKVLEIVTERIKSSAFKRYNPAYLDNPLDKSRFTELSNLDNQYKPAILQ